MQEKLTYSEDMNANPSDIRILFNENYNYLLNTSYGGNSQTIKTVNISLYDSIM